MINCKMLRIYLFNRSGTPHAYELLVSEHSQENTENSGDWKHKHPHLCSITKPDKNIRVDDISITVSWLQRDCSWDMMKNTRHSFKQLKTHLTLARNKSDSLLLQNVQLMQAFFLELKNGNEKRFFFNCLGFWKYQITFSVRINKIRLD